MDDDLIAYLEKKIKALEAERDHWKANHDNQVKLKNEVAETRFVAMKNQIDGLLLENRRLRLSLSREDPRGDGDIDAAISDAERKAADDALPITSEWLKSEFSQKEIECKTCEKTGSAWVAIKLDRMNTIKWSSGANTLMLHQSGDSVRISDDPTRGQLRRLIAALKGGE